jgi:hypothetical protein
VKLKVVSDIIIYYKKIIIFISKEWMIGLTFPCNRLSKDYSENEILKLKHYIMLSIIVW